MSTQKDTNPKDAIAGKKLPLWLLSPIAKAQWALGMYSGMVKYGAWNWRVAGVRASVYLSALHRHLDAYVSGEEYDPTDGTHHLGNIMACAAILLDAKAAGKLTDDRPPSVGIRPTYAELEALVEKLQAQYADKNPRHYTIADTEAAEPGCFVCEHDFCQCPQTSVERPLREPVDEPIPYKLTPLPSLTPFPRPTAPPVFASDLDELSDGIVASWDTDDREKVVVDEPEVFCGAQ